MAGHVDWGQIREGFEYHAKGFGFYWGHQKPINIFELGLICSLLCLRILLGHLCVGYVIYCFALFGEEKELCKIDYIEKSL